MNIIEILKTRFNENEYKLKLEWDEIEKILKTKDLSPVEKMEELKGEPAIFDYDAEVNTFTIIDLVAEMPVERCNITFSQKGEDKRLKANMPVIGNAQTIPYKYGGELLSEEEYIEVQKYKDLDQKTSVWLWTPDEIISKGGGLTGDKRYGRAFIYHNGEQSFYKTRGFRSKVTI